MEVFRASQPLIEIVWERLLRRVADYPPHLAELSREFFGTVGSSYFSQRDAAPILQLPHWLGRQPESDALLRMLEATALAYAAVRVQDNVIDEPTTRGKAPLLLAANAWLWDARDLYSTGADARFAARARESWLCFSEQTEAERRQLAGLDYPEGHFLAHARKCALAEVPLYAVMSQTGDWSGVDHVAPLIHALAVSYGRFNDVTGWERDLGSGANTYLLAAARRMIVARGGTPDFPTVVDYMKFSSLREDFIDAAIADLELALPHAAALRLPEFPSFVEQRTVRLLQFRDGLALARLAALLAA